MAKSDPAGLALRLAAIRRLQDVLAGASFSPLTAQDLADGRDRALANRLVTTALRRQGHLNKIVFHLLDKGLPKKSGSFEAILRLSLAQLLFLPDMGDHSALFLAVEAARRDPKAAHLAKLMNALLRRAQAEADDLRSGPLPVLLPESLSAGWRSAYGAPVLETFATALLEGAPLDLTMKDPSDSQIAALGGALVLADTVRIADRDRPVDALPGYAEGQWWVQDLAAALPARLIDLPRGARVLDLCAAPGGKSAQLIKAGYAVTALDNDAQRLARVKTNLDRLGYRADLVTADATAYEAATPFDAILLDAPCSATGTFRRHPEVLWHRSEADIAARVTLQRRMLLKAWGNLAPGGTLVYAVCSLERAEGEEQMRWALDTLPGIALRPITPGPGLPEGAVTADGALRTHAALTLPVSGGMDGFFAARFVRA